VALKVEPPVVAGVQGAIGAVRVEGLEAMAVY